MIYSDSVYIFIMSEDRPKLKAKRFNKFESSSSRLIPEVENFTKPGVKRNTGDKNHTWNAKRICTNTNLNTSPVKNLANNRLKKLKEQIQASVKSQDLREQTNVPTKSSLKPDYFKNAGKPYGKINKSYPETVVKNKYKNSFIDISPMNSSKNNLAEERLQNIKRKLNSTNSSTKFSSKDRTSDIPSSVERNVKSNIFKRNISSVTDIYDSDDMPNRKVLRKNSLYSTVTEEQNSSVLLIKNKVENPFPDMYSSSPVCCSTPIPEMSKIKKDCPEYAHNSKKPEVTSSPFNSNMCLFSNNENRNSIRYRKNDDTFNAFCQPARKIDVTVDKVNTSTLPVDGSNNFLSKMQMTASWIRNHQVETNFNSFESQNNSSNETAKESLNETKFDGSEEMEWTNAEPDDEIGDPNINISQTCNKDNKSADMIIKDPEKMKDVCVIVDTNVFLSGLSKIQDIINLKITGSFKPIVYVPWMVITELDYMKDSCSNTKLSKNIVNAIKFINASLKNKNPRVIGQTVFDVEKQKHIGASPDDKIISCCIQVAEKYETVILLSNDMNLKTKAMINNIPACSSNEIMIKLMTKLRTNTKTQKIMHKMGVMCSSVICDCMKSTYGDIWLKMDMMSCPPWSLGECLKRFKKYWSSVFSEKLMKQFTKTVQSLKELIDGNKYFSDDSDEFIEFTKLCVTLCVYLKDIEECRGFVENTLSDITKTAQ